MSEHATHGNRSTLLSQVVRVGCKAVAVMALARLVTPAEHGLYAMAGSVIFFLLLFRDVGLGTAAVQAPTLDETQMTTLMWTHLVLGVVVALLTVALAPLARWFYATPAVLPLLVTLSSSFLVLGAGSFARAQLAREMRFREINFLETTATILGTVAMIAAGAAGAGAYSFVVLLFVTEVTNTVLAWRALRWRPHAAFQLRSLRPLFQTSAHLTGYNLLVYLLQQLDILAIGHVFGPRELGLYSRSSQLLALPGQHVATPFTQVALATLSRVGPASPRFHDQVCRTVTLIAHFTLPLAAICVALPSEVVRLVLGSQWPEAGPMLRWLAVSAGVTSITSLAYGVNVAAGQTRRLVWSTALTLPFTALAIWVGLPRGPAGVAFSLAVANVLLATPRLYWSLLGSPVKLRDYGQALLGPLIVALALGLGLTAGMSLTGTLSWAARIAASVAGGMAAVLILSAVWPRLRQEWRTLWTQLPWSRHGTPQTSPT